MLDKKKLQAFFFILLRDRLTFGVIEQIYEDYVENLVGDPEFEKEVEGLAIYCREFVERFEKSPPQEELPLTSLERQPPPSLL